MGLLNYFNQLSRKPTLPDHLLLNGKYHDGKVVCEYVLQGEEKVFDGPFAYEYKYGSLFGEKGYERATGSFVMNRKDGLWKMEYHSSRRDRECQVSFEHGRVEGTVDYQCTETDYMGRVSKTAITFAVHDGHVVGDIRGTFGGKKFSGFCDEDGYPEGQWMVQVDSSDNTLSHVDCEMWNHGILVSSYSKMTRNKTQNDLQPYLLKTFSDLVNGDVLEMLFIVRRGTHINKIEIPVKH